MKYSLSLAALAGFASTALAGPVQASPLTVSLTQMGNSQVKAVITNTGNKGYNIFHEGTILDERVPTDDLSVSNNGAKPDFKGIKMRLATKNLSASGFTALQAGESKEVTLEMASVYDLTHGMHNVLSEGTFRYAELGSTELSPELLHFASNSLSMHIDGAMAKTVANVVDLAKKNSKRSTIQNDCTADQKNVVKQSLDRCYDQATAAAQAALSGSASKFQEYFKSTSTSDRKYVHDRLTAVANECRSTPGGILDVYCTDQYSYCSDNTFAYTVSANDDVIWCNQYYTHPVETTQCHGDDKAGTAIHEFTHASHVFSPGTKDNAYGYTACSQLSRAKALENADTYEYYANAIHLNC